MTSNLIIIVSYNQKKVVTHLWRLFIQEDRTRDRCASFILIWFQRGYQVNRNKRTRTFKRIMVSNFFVPYSTFKFCIDNFILNAAERESSSGGASAVACINHYSSNNNNSNIIMNDNEAWMKYWFFSIILVHIIFLKFLSHGSIFNIIIITNN